MQSSLTDEDAFVAKIVHLLQLDGATLEAKLLAKGTVRIEQVRWDDWHSDVDIYTIFIDISSITYSQLGQRIEKIQKVILAKAQFLLRNIPDEAIRNVELNPSIPYELNWREKVFMVPTEKLVEEVEAQRNLMIAVATGGPRIQEVNEEYKQRQQKINRAVKERGLSNPNPFGDLWTWHAKWSSGDLPTYKSRRVYLYELFQPLIDRLLGTAPPGESMTVFSEPTGWVKIDNGINAARKAIEVANDEIGFQQVGLICRETLINLAQQVFDPDRHRSTDGINPSSTDAKRMLDAYLAAELPGGTNEAARKHAKAALTLANDLTHRRTATFRDAALCAEATTSIINLVAIISGQRDPEEGI